MTLEDFFVGWRVRFRAATNVGPPDPTIAGARLGAAYITGRIEEASVPIDDDAWLELLIGTKDVNSEIVVSVFVPRSEAEQWVAEDAKQPRCTQVGQSVIDLYPPDVTDESLNRFIEEGPPPGA